MMGYRFKQTLILDKANFTYLLVDLIFDQHFTQHFQKDLHFMGTIHAFLESEHYYQHFQEQHLFSYLTSHFKANRTYFHI
jgi:hypothetical protein